MVSVRKSSQAIDQYDAPSWLVTAIGLLFGIAGVAYVLTHPDPIGVWVTEFVLVSVPAAGIVYGGYWVATHQLTRGGRWSIATWSVTGGVVAGSLFFVYFLIERASGATILNPELLVLVGALGGTTVSLFAMISNERRHLTAETGTLDEERVAEMSTDPLSTDARLFAEIVIDTRSWQTLHILALAEKPLGVETIADRVAAIERTDPQLVYADLVHYRLPKLAERELVRYEADVGLVRLTERANTVADAGEELLEAGQYLSRETEA